MQQRFLSLILIIMLPLCSIAQRKDSLYYTAVDQAPEFPGTLHTYVAKLIRVDKTDIEEGFTGKMVATFIITNKGKVRDVKLIKGNGTKTGEEFIRIIKAMPDWKPAMLQGKPVPYKYTFPLQVCFREG